MLAKVIAENLAWEPKGRGIAIFGCPRSRSIGALPVNSHIVDIEDIAHIPDDANRVVVTQFEEMHLSSQRTVQLLIDRILLPAYRRKLPVYFVTDVERRLFSCEELPFGSMALVNEAMGRLKREQIRNLLALSCIFVSNDVSSVTATSTPETPIEAILSKGLRESGIPFEQQVPLGSFIVDFLLTNQEGDLLVVEADGREFHDSERDARRDAELMSKYGVSSVLRFSGCRIWYHQKECIKAIRDRLDQIQQAPMTARKQVYELPLSVEQEACLLPREGAVLTLAPAGSGKTRVLTRRVMDAVSMGARQERILCLVFNNRAAREMEKRINQLAGLHNVKVRTLHSMGLEIATKSQNSDFRGFETKKDIDERKLLSEALRHVRKRNGIRVKHISDDEVSAYGEFISLYKKTLVQPTDSSFGEPVEAFNVAEAKEVLERLDEVYATERHIPFDDQIFRAVQILLTSYLDRVKFQNKFDIVLVDEVQDLTPVQFLLVRLLAMPLNNLFAVGDDDQMIYSFSYADPRNLRSFEDWFEGAKKHYLGENHRCSAEVVRQSANLISYNLNRFKKDIRPVKLDSNSSSDKVRVTTFGSAEMEANEVAQQIIKWHAKGFKYSDIAVLVRVRAVASIVQLALKAAGIPFIPLKDAVFFGSYPVRLLEAYINICLNPLAAKQADLDTALAQPPRFLTTEERKRLSAGGFPAVKLKEGIQSYSEKPIEEFTTAVERVNRFLKSTETNATNGFDFIMGQFALEDHFQKADKNRTNTDALSGTEILNVLHGLASKHASLQEFSNWLKEQRDAESKRDPRSNSGDKADEVLVQTIHKVKGEEFMCVALFHVNENVMPHKLAKETNSESDIEEERRVCYVGVTRASEELLVTATSSDVSRFVAELAVPRGTQTATEKTSASSNRPYAQVEVKPRSRTLLGSILDFIAGLLRG